MLFSKRIVSESPGQGTEWGWGQLAEVGPGGKGRQLERQGQILANRQPKDRGLRPRETTSCPSSPAQGGPGAPSPCSRVFKHLCFQRLP